MVTYPIIVPRNNYKGKDVKKRLKARGDNLRAAVIENAINTLLQAQTEPVQIYDYHHIAEITGLSFGQISELCYGISGSGNGFTACLPQKA